MISIHCERVSTEVVFYTGMNKRAVTRLRAFLFLQTNIFVFSEDALPSFIPVIWSFSHHCNLLDTLCPYSSPLTTS